VYNTTDSHQAYHSYLTRRSVVSVFVRRLFTRDLARHFHGQVLDVGCGIGEFLGFYKASTGVDPNPLLVSECRQRGHQVSIGVAESLPFASQSFDGVLISNVLEHLDHPAAAVSEGARVLRTEGVMVITVPMEAGFRHDATHVTMISADDIHVLAQNSKLRVEQIYHYPLTARWAAEHLYFCELRAVLRPKAA
jgi:ubiquinone/menaquinone biosynthesis C-methylase UbiE